MQQYQPFGGCPVVFNNGRTRHTKGTRYQQENRRQDCGENYDYDREKDYDQRDQGYERQNDYDHDCGHDDDNSRTAGMVYHEPHGLNNLHPVAHALRIGTLFEELNKPMEGCQHQNGGGQYTKGQAIAFAAWEMRLYLNTHRKDQQALQIYRQLCQQADEPNYACTFAPCAANGRTWDWVENPWPWEYEANCDRRA